MKRQRPNKQKPGRGGRRAGSGRPHALAGPLSDAEIIRRAAATVSLVGLDTLASAARRGSLTAARNLVSVLLRAQQDLLKERGQVDPAGVRLKHAPLDAAVRRSLFDTARSL